MTLSPRRTSPYKIQYKRRSSLTCLSQQYSPIESDLCFRHAGYVSELVALECAHVCIAMGAGRTKAVEQLDYGVGLEILINVGDHVKEGAYTDGWSYVLAPQTQCIWSYCSVFAPQTQCRCPAYTPDAVQVVLPASADAMQMILHTLYYIKTKVTARRQVF